MKAKSWKAYNPDAIIKTKLGGRLQQSYRKTNTILGHVKEINEDILDDFVNAFQKRIDFFIDFPDSGKRLLEVSVSFGFLDSCGRIGFLDYDDLLFAFFVD